MMQLLFTLLWPSGVCLRRFQLMTLKFFEVAVASKPSELLQEPHFFQIMSLVYWVLGDKKCSLD